MRILIAEDEKDLNIVWFLTGLWHGAAMNFILWGLYFGAILIIEKLFLGKILAKLPSWVSHAYSLFIIILGWVLFYFEDMGANSNVSGLSLSMPLLTAIKRTLFRLNTSIALPTWR